MENISDKTADAGLIDNESSPGYRKHELLNAGEDPAKDRREEIEMPKSLCNSGSRAGELGSLGHFEEERKDEKDNEVDTLPISMKESSSSSNSSNNSSSSRAPSSRRMKEVVLVRHAQSEENVKFHSFCEGLDRLKQFKLPKGKNVTDSLSLLALDYDAAVSDLGRRQIKDMGIIMRDAEFWARFKPELIISSPLVRAQETMKGIVDPVILAQNPIVVYNGKEKDRNGSSSSSNGSGNIDDKKTGSSVPILIQDGLREATHPEYIFKGSMYARINSFCQSLTEVPEERIVLVGHSQYFKSMLGSTELMQNCDVWKYDFYYSSGDKSKSGNSNQKNYEWSNGRLLFRTDLSSRHPWSKLVVAPADCSNSDTAGRHGNFESDVNAHRTDGNDDNDDNIRRNDNNNDNNSNNNRNNKNDNSNNNDRRSSNGNIPLVSPSSFMASDDPFGTEEVSEESCRICQQTRQETPGEVMIRPCRCSGTQSWVHYSCLNAWRSTSEEAKTRCSVCHFTYVTCKSPLATFLFSKRCHMLLAVAILFVLMTFSGLFFIKLQSRFSDWLVALKLHSDNSTPQLIRRIISFLPSDSQPIDITRTLHSIAVVNVWWEMCVHNQYFARIMTEGTFGEKLQWMPYFIACKYDNLKEFLYIFETGLIVVSILVFIARQSAAIKEFAETGDYRSIAITGLSLCSLGNAALLRLGLFIGIALSMKDIYEIACHRSKVVGFILGEKILEPHY